MKLSTQATVPSLSPNPLPFGTEIASAQIENAGCFLFPVDQDLGLAGRYTQVEASVVKNKGSVSYCLRNPGSRVMDRHIFYTGFPG